jgi:predicted dehydrogenase
MTKRKITRRCFLATTGAALTVPHVITSAALGSATKPPASERVVLGIIGLGGRAMGQGLMRSFLAEPDAQMAAVCDVQRSRREAGLAAVHGTYQNKDCTAYRDLRDVLARPDIDAVVIATGDRWHALASMMAAKAGKDVYCEKPMSLTIGEGRAVADTMRRHARVYQCGTQRRSDPRYAYAVQVARSGKLGRLQAIYAYTPGFLANVGDFWGRPAEPVPGRETVDWDLWLGPVAWRPYNAAYIGGLGGWSHVPDLGGGGITDWGAHQADLAQAANNAEATTVVECEQTKPGQVVTKYANGVKLVFQEGLGGDVLKARFEGTEGQITVGDNTNLVSDPPSLAADYTGSLVRGQPAENHIRIFLDCIKSRKQPVCHAEVAHRATTACHIANLCVCLRRPLKWDPAREAFLGDEMADRLRCRAVRQPWCW